MKTVKDYLDLGLVFVDSDKLLSVSNDKDSKEVCMSGLCIAHQRYCDGLRGGNAIFFYPSEWAPSSFSWRNNDGVKPEYNGAMKVELSSGDVIFNCGKTSEFDWRINDNVNPKILRWKPIVISAGISGCGYSFAINECQKPSFLQQKPKINLIVPDSLKSEVRRVGGEVNVTISQKYKQEEAPKTTMTVNIEGRDYLIPSRTPTVLLKEDKPMKPVYTAEMHARNELPPVDSKVKVCIEEAGFALDGDDSKFEGKTVTVKAVFINKEGKKIVAIENDKGNCTCYIIECIKPIIKTIKVNGFDVPAPMSEAPELGDEYFTPQTGYAVFYCANKWISDGYDHRFLSRGLVHATESAAIAHAKAMLGINPNPARGGDGHDRNVLGQNNEGDEI